MQETVNQDVIQESVPPTVDEVSQVQDQSNGQEVNDQNQELAGQPETDKDHNFAAIRERNAQLQRQSDESALRAQEAEKRNETLLQAMADRNAEHREPPQEEVDELSGVAHDDWTTREQNEKITKKIVNTDTKKIVENALAADRKRRDLEELPGKLRNRYSDFDSVVTKENVEYLKANYPDIAQSLAGNADPYSQASGTYEAVKAFCQSAAVQDDKQRAEQNLKRPGTLGAAQSSHSLSEAKKFERGLTPELKKQLQKEMSDSIKGS